MRNDITEIYRSAISASRAFKGLSSQIDSGRMSHAYLVVSSDPEALRQFFMLTAVYIFCKEGACFECVDCQRVLNLNHPDILHTNIANDKISVADVAEITDEAQIRPILGGKKLFFIYNADGMQPLAQNKLLKTLEEPPSESIFFLGTTQESKILDTVKSRTRKIYIDLFDTETTYRAAYAVTGDEKRSRLAAACADGLLSRALEIASGDTFENSFYAAVLALKNIVKPADFASFFESKFMKKDSVGEFLTSLSIILRDVMVYPAKKDLILSKHAEKDIDFLATHYSPAACAAALSAVSSVREKLSLNVDAKAAVEKLFLTILEYRQ